MQELAPLVGWDGTMTLARNDLIETFGPIVFEVFVPDWVQRQAPGVKTHFVALMKDLDFQNAVFEIASKSVGNHTTVFDVILSRLLIKDADATLLRSQIYNKITDDMSFFDAFFGRHMTQGNEMCPSWEAYHFPPKRS